MNFIFYIILYYIFVFVVALFLFFFFFVFGKVDFEFIYKMLKTQTRFAQRSQNKPDTMTEIADMFYTLVFGDTEFSVPKRYVDLKPRGVGAQGMVV